MSLWQSASVISIEDHGKFRCHLDPSRPVKCFIPSFKNQDQCFIVIFNAVEMFTPFPTPREFSRRAGEI